jgi:2-(1,2-epoxy-1,2-dihydrophenyl)acetyl-CoA isomerase
MSIDVTRADGIVHVTLNSPQRRNALTPEEFADLGAELDAIAVSSTDRAVLIRGAGGAFCAGAYLAATLPEEPTVMLLSRIHETFSRLHRLPQPVVAAVEGPAYGAGMSLALAADIVVASPSATFCQVFVKRGLVPDSGSSWLLPRIVGLQAAKRLVLLGDAIDAPEAQSLGIVTEIAEDVGARAEQIAARLAAGAPIAQRLAKQLLNSSLGRGFDEQLDAEATSASTVTVTQDVAEAFAAFAQKREPVFTGR